MLIPKQVASLTKIVACERSRYAMTAIRIERHPGQCRAMATDGRRAVIFSWEEPDASSFPLIHGLSSVPVPRFAVNIPAKSLADTARGIARHCIKPILGHMLLDESGSDTVHLAATTLDNVTRAEARAEEGAFPPVEDVVPRPAQEGNIYDHKRHGELGFTHIHIGMNAKLLAQTLQVLADLAADDPASTVVLTVPVTPSRPLRLDARCSGRRATAVVMPVAVDFASYEQQPPSPAAATKTARSAVAA